VPVATFVQYPLAYPAYTVGASGYGLEQQLQSLKLELEIQRLRNDVLQLKGFAPQTLAPAASAPRPLELVAIDARPSDSIAIALRCGAPIFVADDLLLVPSDDDTGDDGGDDLIGEPPPRRSQEELSAEALQRHLATLRPEDFGKFKP
jgi:hypothetical protein